MLRMLLEFKQMSVTLAAVTPSIYFVYRKALCYRIGFPGITVVYGET